MPDTAFLEAADRLGNRLCRDAIWADDQCNWLGWAMEVVGSSWSVVYKAQGERLYDGTSGIALFLARLYSFTQDPLHKTTATGALNHALAHVRSMPANIRPSLYSGGAGIAWTALELGSIFGHDGLTRHGLGLLGEMARPDSASGFVDVLGGSAGTIQVLLDAARRHQGDLLLDLARQHGRILLDTAVRGAAGWSWDTMPGQTAQHLAGYGHGAGGIGCALLDLWAATAETDFRRAAVEAFRYERSHFSPQHHNWPDLRSMTEYGVPAGQQVFATAWCHGGPGIGLSRLRALELLENDGEILSDLNEALQSTVAACNPLSFPASGSMCLCHGIGGNADLLIGAADTHGRSDLRQIAENAGHEAIEQIQKPEMPWPCGVNGGGETPNLMLGLAGIGHFFLRLHDSRRVPSILLFRPGRTGHVQHNNTLAAQHAA